MTESEEKSRLIEAAWKWIVLREADGRFGRIRGAERMEAGDGPYDLVLEALGEAGANASCACGDYTPLRRIGLRLASGEEEGMISVLAEELPSGKSACEAFAFRAEGGGF